MITSYLEVVGCSSCKYSEPVLSGFAKGNALSMPEYKCKFSGEISNLPCLKYEHKEEEENKFTFSKMLSQQEE